MKFKKLKNYAVLLILILALGWAATKLKLEEPENNSIICIDEAEFVEVRGSSLAPLINPGETIKLVYGYYDSQPVEREDIIAYKYAGNDVPIIKIVKAVPEDRWELRKSNDSYLIVVNEQPLINSEGKYYQIPESNIKMLNLYVEDYPVLPDNTYLILGNKASGSLDATRFGLIDKSDIVGKIEMSQ